MWVFERALCGTVPGVCFLDKLGEMPHDKEFVTVLCIYKEKEERSQVSHKFLSLG